MNNIERISKHIHENKGKGLLIHSIPGTQLWLMCEKIQEDAWSIYLGKPNGTIIYNLGLINNQQHLDIWMELTRMEIKQKVGQIQLAKQYKEKIYQFIKRNNKIYKKFIKP